VAPFEGLKQYHVLWAWLCIRSWHKSCAMNTYPCQCKFQVKNTLLEHVVLQILSTVLGRGKPVDEFKRFDIASAVTDSLIEVFDMMLSMKLELSDDDSLSIVEGERIVGSVSLAGKVKGIIIFMVTEEFSRLITASMLGIEVEEVEGQDDVKDVIRELCNIVGGSLKSSFCDVGLTCELSPPSFTTGSDFRIESLNTVRHERFVFSYDQQPVIVQVGVRASDAQDDDKGAEPMQQTKAGTIDDLNDFDIKTPLNKSLIELFDTMLSMEIQPFEESLEPTLEGARIMGSVDLVGPLTGTINILISEKFLHEMTASMLGIEQEEVDGEDDVGTSQ